MKTRDWIFAGTERGGALDAQGWRRPRPRSAACKRRTESGGGINEATVSGGPAPERGPRTPALQPWQECEPLFVRAFFFFVFSLPTPEAHAHLLPSEIVHAGSALGDRQLQCYGGARKMMGQRGLESTGARFGSPHVTPAQMGILANQTAHVRTWLGRR